ncbi:MAG: helicase-associated domain-containing protein [Bacillota bacterium]|nr:helicase-associated domain-containing protein [Bacillota bacterium]
MTPSSPSSRGMPELAARFRRLSPFAQEVLFAAAWITPARGFPGAEVARLLERQGAPRGAVEPALRELVEQGFLRGRAHPAYSGWYWFPSEQAVPLGLLATVARNERLPAEARFLVEGEAVEAKAASRGALAVAELVRLAGELECQPARFRRSGGLYKRDAQRLAGVLDPAPLAASAPAWRHFDAFARPGLDAGLLAIPFQQEEPELRPLLAAALATGLAEETGELLLASPSWIARLESNPPERVWQAVLAASLGGLARHEGRVEILRALLLQAGERWFAPARWLRACVPYLEPFELQACYEAASVLLFTLAQVGVLEAGLLPAPPRAGREGAEEAAVRLAPPSRTLFEEAPAPTVYEPDSRFHLLPTGEALAPPFLAPAVLARLELLGERRRVDRVTAYRLTAASLRRALERGWKPDALLDWIEAHASAPLPDAVRFQLSEWTGRWGQVQLLEVLLLECAGEELADRLLADPRLAPCFNGRLDPRRLVVRSDRLDDLRRRLEEAGLPLPRRIERPSEAARPALGRK